MSGVSITSSQCSCWFLLSKFLHFIILSAGPEQVASSHALLKLLSAKGKLSVLLVPPRAWGCVYSSPYLFHTPMPFAHFFDNRGVHSTLHHTGFEAHDILRNHHHPGKSAKCQWTDPHQWALVSTDEQDDGEEVARCLWPRCSQACLFWALHLTS